jgi:hypothetical protein
MNWRQRIIADDYNGDAKRFEADFAEAVEEGRLYTVQWDELALASTTLPNLENAGRDLIERQLGYLPHDNCILSQEPFIRALIQAHQSGQLANDAFEQQIQDHVKLIRNIDMRHNTCLAYDAVIYENYHKTFAPYGYAVRSRLSHFLGYEPQQEHSLIAEMWLRDVMARDMIQLPETITPIDWKAITLIKYREVLLEQGQTAADASPLLQLVTE